MRVLITAGPVYGRLDDNKLVGNRTRGIWAAVFAKWLTELGVNVTLLVPDTHASDIKKRAGTSPLLTVVQHKGFHDYRARCYEFAETHDAAVMASAVVNWIPLNPISGKMVTKGYKEGDVIDIPFVLAERVIDRMRKINPSLTLIGCKMLVGSTYDELIDAAYQDVILASKANVVLANDLNDLHVKHLVYPDRCVQTFGDDWNGLYDTLWGVIQDRHWQTKHTTVTSESVRLNEPRAMALFDQIVDKYRDRFMPRGDGKVFGSLLIPLGPGMGYLASPREKGTLFTSQDAVYVAPRPDNASSTVFVGAGPKATMNAPLLVRMACWAQTLGTQGSCFATGQPVVLHLHEQLPGVPTVPYAPPGTDRDNLREIPGPAFNIEGHGFVACLDENLEILR